MTRINIIDPSHLSDSWLLAEYRPHPEWLNEDWIPCDEDININLSRLLEKFDKGQQHKLDGMPITKEQFISSIKGINL